MPAPVNHPRPRVPLTWLSIITLALVALIGGGALWSSASWLPKLALDLEGGTSIILEPEVAEGTRIQTEQLDQAVEIIRQRVDSTGVSEAEITTQGDRNIIVNLPGNPDEETRNLVRSSAQLSFRRVAHVGAPEPMTAEGNPDEQAPEQPELSEEEKKKLEEIFPQEAPEEDAPQGGGAVAQPAESQAPAEDGKGDSDVVPRPAESGGAEEATDEVPRFDPAADQSWMNEKIMAQFAELDCTDEANRTGGDSGPADEPVVSCARDGSAKFILGPVELSGEHVKNASMDYESGANGVQTNRPAVNMQFDSTGADIFGKITTAITGQQPPLNQFAIVLDGLVLSAPESRTPVTDGNAQITGSFTEEEADTLANQLKNGSLPISFHVQSEQQISPTLGADYLAKGLLAGAIGVLLVIIYSLFQYRALGMLTVTSLVVAGVLTYLALLLVSWRYGYRLSLAGIAGIIIGITAAADSIIVYFERVRDELRSGRRLLSAVEVGWARAKRTIYASKSVNMLAAIILYILAVGSVRGFAFTLGLTVVIDVLVVVLFTHPMLQILARTKFFGNGHPWSGMDPRQLGVKPAAYRGAMNLDLEAAERKSRKRSSGKEAARRQALIDRKNAAAEDAEVERPRRKKRDSATTETPATRRSRRGTSSAEGREKTTATAGAAGRKTSTAVADPDEAGLSLAERKARRRAAEAERDEDGTTEGKGEKK